MQILVSVRVIYCFQIHHAVHKQHALPSKRAGGFSGCIPSTAAYGVSIQHASMLSPNRIASRGRERFACRRHARMACTSVVGLSCVVWVDLSRLVCSLDLVVHAATAAEPEAWEAGGSACPTLGMPYCSVSLLWYLCGGVSSSISRCSMCSPFLRSFVVGASRARMVAGTQPEGSTNEFSMAWVGFPPEASSVNAQYAVENSYIANVFLTPTRVEDVLRVHRFHAGPFRTFPKGHQAPSATKSSPCTTTAACHPG